MVQLVWPELSWKHDYLMFGTVLAACYIATITVTATGTSDGIWLCESGSLGWCIFTYVNSGFQLIMCGVIFGVGCGCFDSPGTRCEFHGFVVFAALLQGIVGFVWYLSYVANYFIEHGPCGGEGALAGCEPPGDSWSGPGYPLFPPTTQQGVLTGLSWACYFLLLPLVIISGARYWEYENEDDLPPLPVTTTTTPNIVQPYSSGQFIASQRQQTMTASFYPSPYQQSIPTVRAEVVPQPSQKDERKHENGFYLAFFFLPWSCCYFCKAASGSPDDISPREYGFKTASYLMLFFHTIFWLSCAVIIIMLIANALSCICTY